MKLELPRNNGRFGFLKWGCIAFKNMLVVPLGSGIVHEVQLDAPMFCITVGLLPLSLFQAEKEAFEEAEKVRQAQEEEESRQAREEGERRGRDRDRDWRHPHRDRYREKYRRVTGWLDIWMSALED